MNLLTSYDWLKEFIDLKGIKPEEFASRVSLSGPGVEKLYPQGAGLEHIVVGHVTKIESHPNADKLNVAVVDIGTGVPAHIVCGGSNLKQDQWVVVAKVGARVKWHGEGDPVELKPAEIRGVKSEGMICAANEIGLFDFFPHGEREILDLQEALPVAKLKAGVLLADVLGFSTDVVMDIEVTTNRPDSMCLVGMAREAAAILKRPFLWKPAPKIKAGKAALTAHVMDKKMCPRFSLVKIDGVKVGPSPWWLKRRLASAGMRSVNNVVDITNFVMLELGQPMHVYDADKLTGALTVRRARAGERLGALNGKEYELDDSMLIVADAERPVDLIGVMGGEATGVTEASTSILFESATLDPVLVRRTARKLNLYSEAQALFEKGLSTEAPLIALARAVEVCLELAGGTVRSNVVDITSGTYQPKKYSITTDEVTSLIGVPLKMAEMKATLVRLGFKVQATGKKMTATVPWWRDHDIEAGRDLVEEIARVYGYGNLEPVFPAGVATRPQDPELMWEKRVRELASGAGLTEVYTYSFVSRELMEKGGYDPSVMLRVSNPLTADFEFMRTTLLPSLIQTSIENQERFRTHQIFEIAHVYYPRTKDWSDLPDERLELGAAFLGGDEAWKKAKGFVEFLYRSLGIEGVEWRALKDDDFWHPGRTAQAFQGEHLLGTVGELHPTIAQRFKVEGRLALVDLPLEKVFALATSAKRYEPAPIYPVALRDLAFLVSRMSSVGDLTKVMKNASDLLQKVEWFDTYEGKGVAEGKKSVAFHLTFGRTDRTLEAAEVDAAMKAIEQHLKDQCQAELRAI